MEFAAQVWAQCSDVHIIGSGGDSEVIPRSPPDSHETKPDHSTAVSSVASGLLSASRHRVPLDRVCLGGSLGLDVVDCDAWVSLYDAMGGAHWPQSWRDGCADLRTDPCGCNGHEWRKFVRW